MKSKKKKEKRKNKKMKDSKTVDKEEVGKERRGVQRNRKRKRKRISCRYCRRNLLHRNSKGEVRECPLSSTFHLIRIFSCVIRKATLQYCANGDGWMPVRRL